VMYQGTPQQIAQAQKVLTEMQGMPGAWTRVDAVLTGTDNQMSKYFALQILDNTIKFQWRALPREQCEGIKNFVVDLIVKLSSTNETLRTQKLYIDKLNLILVQLLKQEWPHSWKTFIPDIVKSSNANLCLCENNLNILKLLSEEIFDFSRDQMTQAKIQELKTSLNEEFAGIHQLCNVILAEATVPTLLMVCLEALERFLVWMPLAYIFETNMVHAMIFRFFPDPANAVPELQPYYTRFQVRALSCLSEIGSLSVEQQYDPAFAKLCTQLIAQLAHYLPSDTNLAAMFDTFDESHQEFVQNLAMFLSNFLRKHLKVLEDDHTETLPNGVEVKTKMVLEEALKYLVQISAIDEDELFKICLDYWNALASDLYGTERQFSSSNTMLGGMGGGGGLMGGMMGSGLGDFALGGSPAAVAAPNNPRLKFFRPVLSAVRDIVISKMAKPEEVLIVEDENGDVVRETMPDIDSIQLYKSMKSTLVYLTHLDQEDTQKIMLSKLDSQVNGKDWDRNKLNKLCWAIGSISLTMSEQEEKTFLVSIIRDLLGLCEQKKGKDNKAVIASNIMYVVGQYPRFLKQHWKFLKTVVNKLFEFMHESHPGVQDMACETFLKIAQKCRRKFVVNQPSETSAMMHKTQAGGHPFIHDILEDLEKTIRDLQVHQIHMFYEALGYMLQAEYESKSQEALLRRLMDLPNRMWGDYIAQAQQNVAILQSTDVMKNVQNILKTNVRVCRAMRHRFLPQLQNIYVGTLSMYKAYSEMITSVVAQGGVNASVTSGVKAMRGVRREVLRLIITFMEHSEDPRTVCDQFVPPLLDPVLGDYQRSIPNCRDHEVLTLMSTMVNKLKSAVQDRVPAILEAVFQCTLEMITTNFTDYPEHRLQFYRVLEAVNKHCFSILFAIPEEVFKVFVDAVVWAMKHTDRDISEVGLTILLDLLKNLSSPECPGTAASAFYQKFFVLIMNEVFAVLTDSSHKPGFKLQAEILTTMFNLVETGMIAAPLFDLSAHAPGTTNPLFLRQHLAALFSSSFPNLVRSQVETFVMALFEKNSDQNAFKTLLRDFLVTLKTFSTSDNDELWAEESSVQRQQLEAAMPAALRTTDVVAQADEDAAMQEL